jgi:serine/threonine protein kinase
MEFIDGATLAAEIKKGPLPLELVARYGAQIASALAEAHARGIVHRDLKPSNVMVTRHGVKVLDFGLAKTTSEGNPPSEIGITETSDLMGTPAYMAPEQAEGRPPTSVADLFSLGLVLYEMAVGKLPFPGASLGQMLSSGSQVAVPAPSRVRTGVPAGLDALVAQLLEKDPSNRPQSAAGVARELSTLADRLAAPPSPVRAILRPVFTVPAVLFFLVLTMGGIWLYRRSHQLISQQISQQSAAPQPLAESSIREKRLTFNSSESPVEGGDISPDGKYLESTLRCFPPGKIGSFQGLPEFRTASIGQSIRGFPTAHDCSPTHGNRVAIRTCGQYRY